MKEVKEVKEQLTAEKDSLKAANDELRKKVKAMENEKILLKESLAEAESARSRLAAELTKSVSAHTGVNKKLQVGLSGLSEEPLGVRSQMEDGAEVKDVKNPLGLENIPSLFTTTEKGAAVKATKATLVMKSEGVRTFEKRPRRLVARGSLRVGAKIKMSSAGRDIPCVVVEVREAFYSEKHLLQIFYKKNKGFSFRKCDKRG